MVKLIILFITLLGLASCIRHQENDQNLDVSEDFQIDIEIKYAKGFLVENVKGGIKLVTCSLEGNQPYRDSVYIKTQANFIAREGMKIIQPEKLRIACQSSTYIAYLKALNQISSITGVCGIDYVSDLETIKELNRNEVVEICPADQLEIEALYTSNPTLLLTYPFGSTKDQDYYKEKGIPTLLVGEYLEESQLARLEWIKLFGLITGKLQEANAYFQAVETDYLNMRQPKDESHPTFIMNLPFQDEWYMPSASSVGVELIEDAGLSYFYRNELGTENKLHAKEEVWNDGMIADYWIIIAREKPNFTLKDLCAQSPVYSEFKSVKQKHVIFCNTATVDYFASGVVEPHLILKDLRFALGHSVIHEPRYFFRLE